jgi:hypothetical protein
MTIQHSARGARSTVSSSREPGVTAEGQEPFMNTRDWRNGRLVLRRPEARNSAVAKCYIAQTPAEAQAFADTLVTAVEERRQMPPERRAAELDEVAALAAKENLSAG